MSKGTEIEKAQKRLAGQLKDGEWLVLTESTREEGKPFIHSCGETIMAAHLIWDWPFPESGETWPYCPRCEEKPDFNGSPIGLREILWPYPLAGVGTGLRKKEDGLG